MDFKKLVAELQKLEEPQKDLRKLSKVTTDPKDKEYVLKAILDNPRHRGDVEFVDDNLPVGSHLAVLIPDILAEYNKQDPHWLKEATK